jgi:hypothetical protein
MVVLLLISPMLLLQLLLPMREVKAWRLTDDRVMAIICRTTDLSIRSS